ncbi:AGAP005182-PA [Anopheles gambiae str. PEST]|uniref:AGAP005182-PA n=1 Tax=Anopheles gambiae TaxID=7165 RepID=Q8I8Q5_ANOGA|nr:odorant-binding protein AgamOBP41 [Anopheles gambiae]EAA44537.1 AGAP005182-PA [Anopheles gambiae str. PEST]
MGYWALGTGLQLLLLILVLGGSELQVKAKGSLILRSFDEMVLECAELMSIVHSKLARIRSGVMLPDEDTKCLIRCVGISGRFWNDHTGLRKELLARYFVTDPADAYNVNRTETCLQELPALELNAEKCCGLAFESFLCYYYNYGNLRQDSVFVPLDHLQLQHVTSRCMDVHQITTEQLMSLSAEAMDANDKLHCLVRCIGLQTGVYSDREGVSIDRLNAQYGEGHCEKEFKTHAVECITKHRELAYGSPCKRAYHLLYKCFENVRNVISAYELPDSDGN